MSIKRLITIMKKEFIHIKRDKASVIIAVIIPIFFTLVLGYAVNTDVENIKIAVLDQDKSQESREYISKFANSNYFSMKIYTDSIDEVERLINNGDVKGALIIPGDFQKKINRNDEAKAQLIIDGSDPTVANTALQSGMLTSKMHSIEKQQEDLLKNGGIYTNTQTVDLRTRVWFNPNLESTKFTIPGLIGLIMQNITVLLTAFTLVREREKGTLEQLIVTPVKAAELIIGKMIPYILIGTIDFLIALFFGTYWFKVPIEGNVILLIFLGIGFVICALAIGMLISTIASNQLQAMQMTLLILLPSVILSGFIFPREAMPVPIAFIGYMVPLTYFINILRGIILKGVGLKYLWKDVVILIGFGVALLTLASFRFKKRLD